MKCPHRTKIIYREGVTEHEFMDCYETECPYYMSEHRFHNIDGKEITVRPGCGLCGKQ